MNTRCSRAPLSFAFFCWFICFVFPRDAQDAPRVEIVGGLGAHHTEDPIAGAASQDLFQGESSGVKFTIIFRVPNAHYQLEAGFSEIYWDADGARVFDIQINGAPWLHEFDIYKEANGKNKALVKTREVSAVDGEVKLEFTTKNDRAKFSYLQLTGGGLRAPILIRGGSLLTTGAEISKTKKELLPSAPSEFEVSVVAQDPQIAFPTVIAGAPSRADGTGILFVAEDLYNAISNVEGERPDLDRILRLELDPATGKAARAAEFARGFGSIQGLCYVNDTLFVAAAPEVVALRDRDGDGKADEREVILSDCGPAPGIFALRHHIPSGLQFGVDGKLTLSIGDHGARARNRFGESVDLEGGGTLRFFLDGRGLQIFTSGLRNTLHHCENEWGEWFTRDNTNDGDGWDARLFHLIPGGNYGYPYLFKKHPDEILKPIGEYGGGSSTGCAVYQETNFPQMYHGRLFAADWARREVYSIQLEKRGATYKPNVELFLSQEEGGARDFRPTGMTVDDRGDLLVADWARDSWGASERIGRILRIHTKGKEPQKIAPIRNVSDAVSMLNDPRRSARDAASAFFRASMEKDAESALAGIVDINDKDNKKNVTDLARLHALWILSNRNAGGIVRILSGLTHDPNDFLAAQAARALGEFREGRALEPLTAALQPSNAKHPFTQREAAIAIGKIANTWIPALAQFTNEGDPVLVYCKIQAIRRIGKFDPALAELASPQPRVANAMQIVVADLYQPEVVRALAENYYLPKFAAARAEIVHLLGRVALAAAPWNGIDWWGTQPRVPRPKMYHWDGTPIALSVIRDGLLSNDPSVQKAAIEAAEESPAVELAAPLCEILKNGNIPEKLRIIKILVSMPGMAGRAAAAQAAADSSGDVRGAVADALAGSADEKLKIILLNLTNDADARVALRAVEALRETVYPGAIPRLRECLQIVSDDKIRSAAAFALEHQLPKMSNAELEKTALELLADPAVREPAIMILTKVGSCSALQPLLKIAAGESPSGRSLRERALEAALAIVGSAAPKPGRDDAALDRWFEWASKEIPNFIEPPRAAGGDLRKRMSKLASIALEKKGNIEKGRAIFNDPAGAKCYACHRVGGEGIGVGPDLTEVGAKYSKKFLIESVLEPSKVIHSGYDTTVIELDGEPPVSGTVLTEDSQNIEIATGPDQKRKLTKDRVRGRSVQPISPMPSGLVDGLDDAGFVDLIEYLYSCRGKK